MAVENRRGRFPFRRPLDHRRLVKPRLRPSLELLEDRRLLATFTVNSGIVADLVSAINSANTNGDPSNTIDLTGTYDLSTVNNNTSGPVGLPAITSNLAIVGNASSGAVIERSTAGGTPAFRLLYVSAAGSLSLEDLTLSGGMAQGFAGGSSDQGGGGGGGAGMGGAVYDNGGTFTAEGVTFTNNQAVGGQGGDSGSAGSIIGGGGGGQGGAGKNGAARRGCGQRPLRATAATVALAATAVLAVAAAAAVSPRRCPAVSSLALPAQAARVALAAAAAAGLLVTQWAPVAAVPCLAAVLAMRGPPAATPTAAAAVAEPDWAAPSSATAGRSHSSTTH